MMRTTDIFLGCPRGFEAVRSRKLPRHKIGAQIDFAVSPTIADPPFILHLAVALQSATLCDDGLVAIAAGAPVM